jgi:hypothetical protein
MAQLDTEPSLDTLRARYSDDALDVSQDEMVPKLASAAAAPAGRADKPTDPAPSNTRKEAYHAPGWLSESLLDFANNSDDDEHEEQFWRMTIAGTAHGQLTLQVGIIIMHESYMVNIRRYVCST